MTEPENKARLRRRLEEEGWDLETSAMDKRWWREHGGERRLVETHAMRELVEKEERRLREKGWEPVEGGPGGSYWRNPDSGRLYPRDAAYDLVFGGEPEETA